MSLALADDIGDATDWCSTANKLRLCSLAQTWTKVNIAKEVAATFRSAVAIFCDLRAGWPQHWNFTGKVFGQVAPDDFHTMLRSEQNLLSATLLRMVVVPSSEPAGLRSRLRQGARLKDTAQPEPDPTLPYRLVDLCDCWRQLNGKKTFWSSFRLPPLQ